MTCRECNWLVLIDKGHLRKGIPQSGFCRKHCERVDADDETCKDYAHMNEGILKSRVAIAAYNRTRKKRNERED